MKNQFKILVCCFMITSATLAQSVEEKELSIAVEALRKAMVDADENALNDLTMDELSYGHSSWKIEDKKDFVDHIVQKKSDFVSIALTDQAIRIVGNTAIVRHTFLADTNDNNVPGKVKLGVLLIWQKQNGKWKLLARQATKV